MLDGMEHVLRWATPCKVENCDWAGSVAGHIHCQQATLQRATAQGIDGAGKWMELPSNLVACEGRVQTLKSGIMATLDGCHTFHQESN
jgi:hypothetical protein